jgi:NADH-quinone oxidoreductase subunit E
MSIFSIPDELLPNKTMLDKMTKETMAEVPAEIASTVNLMAHPMAGVAAMSAIGIGFASQAIGIWFGALSGATAASQRLLSPMFDELDVDAFREPREPEVRAESGAAKLSAVAEAIVEPKKAAAKRAIDTPSLDAASAEVKPPVAPAPKPEAVKARKAKSSGPKAKVQVADVPTAAAEPAAAASVTPVSTVALRQPAAIAMPERVDDLKAISGVGPKVEQVLNGLGIWTYAQVAAWNEAEVAWVDDMLGFNGRIRRDDWLGQAAKLAANSSVGS